MSARWSGGGTEESWPSAIRALVAALLVAVLIIIGLAITAVDPVEAGSPSDRCLACRQATPRPEPTVIGLPVGASRPDAGPSVTLPPTDTAP